MQPERHRAPRVNLVPLLAMTILAALFSAAARGQPPEPPGRPPSAEEIFEKYDTDGDGQLSPEEWGALYEDLVRGRLPGLGGAREPLRRGSPRADSPGPPGGPFPGGPPRPDLPLVVRPYGQGTKRLEVDAGKTVGKIRSLLGVNRGPLFFRRAPGAFFAGRPVERIFDDSESYRALGIDFIRTHDFYGPTDWYVIFADWTADPEDPASYDFRSSDVRIKAIVENGFRCFYRLGTSWKGAPDSRPMINDPPGTIRGPDGRITHRADRNDFRKWARICVGTVRHYTEGWKHGFRYAIRYWEIWNEPEVRSQFWTGTPEQFYIMYEEVARAIKALNPDLKVGGPACTGGLPEPYAEEFIRYCRDHDVPLDFFSWHTYGKPWDPNPYQFYGRAIHIRKMLDRYGFRKTENINTEWNLADGRFGDSPIAGAFFASALACMLDAGVDRAFQYCGDRQGGFGLHDPRAGEPRMCAQAFLAWRRLLGAPERIAGGGSDRRGYNVVAGKDGDGRRIRILISDFQSGHDAFRLRVRNLPWDEATRFKVKRSLLDAEHRRLAPVEELAGKGRDWTLERPFRSGSICLIEIDRLSEAGD